MKDNITIALTSCGRLSLLKKTIESLEKSCDLSSYYKVMSEDSTDEKHIKKIKTEQEKGFLKGWQIIFTGGIGGINQEKHYNALKKLYKNIQTKYVFHLEDDWYFKKTNFDFIDLSRKILDKNKKIGLIQLEDTNKSGSLNSIQHTRKQRYAQLYSKEELKFENICFKVFNYKGENIDRHCGFSLRPGLRRTLECRDIYFGGSENYVNEILMAERFRKKGLIGICVKDGIGIHLGTPFKSTKFSIKNYKKVWNGFYQYRIKTLILKRKIIPMLNFLYKKLDLFYPTRYLMDILSWIYRLYKVKPITKDLLNNIEGIKEMNIHISWFTEEKPLGISGVARLKNGDDFLEKVIESHLPFLDEIILVDNQSTDNTKKICLKLQKKYPKKIKFFEYNYNSFPPGAHNRIKDNSIHSTVYYNNWAMSKSKYKYVMKVDDDNLFNKEKGMKMRKYILKNKPKKYVVYWGYNLTKNKSGKIGVFKANPYIGRHGDHGIYSISNKTYYINSGNIKEGFCEIFNHNLLYKRFGFGFYHLKYLKKNFGLINVKNTYWGNYFLNILQKREILDIKISDKIINLINKK